MASTHNRSRGRTPVQKDKASQAEAAAQRKTKYMAAIGIVIIVAAIAGALVYGLKPTQPSSIGQFQHALMAANTIGIYVGDFNQSGYPPADGCANNLIEVMVASVQHHRAPGSINFFVINQTSCLYSHGLGSTINTTAMNATQCMGFSATEPSIFVNYSTVNSTMVKGNVLYVSGDLKFLSECGVASELYPG